MCNAAVMKLCLHGNLVPNEGSLEKAMLYQGLSGHQKNLKHHLHEPFGLSPLPSSQPNTSYQLTLLRDYRASTVTCVCVPVVPKSYVEANTGGSGGCPGNCCQVQLLGGKLLSESLQHLSTLCYYQNQEDCHSIRYED